MQKNTLSVCVQRVYVTYNLVCILSLRLSLEYVTDDKMHSNYNNFLNMNNFFNISWELDNVSPIISNKDNNLQKWIEIKDTLSF